MRIPMAQGGIVIRPLLQLCRIPNVFTAFANVVAAVVLVRGEFHFGDLLLVAASGALYCGGMILNDYFDRDVDARERPDRPIPSGAITARGAGALGAVAVTGGIGLAAAHGARSGLVALALAAAILAYDAVLKSTRWGPLSMGTCRGLNLLLGASAVPLAQAPAGAWTAAAFATLFTTGITVLSRDEVFGTEARNARPVVIAMAALGACLPGLAILASTPTSPFAWVAVALSTLFVWVRGASLFAPLAKSAAPPLLGRAIGGGILLMPALDATFVAGAGHLGAAATVFALAGPAYLLKRAFYST